MISPALENVLPTLFAWVWNASLAISFLIGLIVLVQLTLRKVLPPRGRYALWLLVVLRLMLPPLPSTRFSLSPDNLANSLPGPTMANSSTFAATPGAQKRSEEPALPLHPKGEEAGVPFHRRDHTASTAYERPWREFRASLVWLWLLGMTGYFVVVFRQHRKLSSWTKTQKPISSPRVLAILNQAAEIMDLRQSVRVIESNPRQAAASVFGWLKPRLLLSRKTMENFTDQELRLVLAHELVHIQRRDVFMNWVIILLQGLHWFNPLVWLAMRHLRSDRELVCDAVVLRRLSREERQTYGATLIKMLDGFSGSSFIPSLVPMLNHKHEIHKRITMIAQFKPATRLVTVTSIMALVVLAGITFLSAAEKPPVQPPEKSVDADSLKQHELAQRGIKILEEELARRDAEMKQLERKVDALKESLRIPDSEHPSDARQGWENDSVRKLGVFRLEKKAEFFHADSLYTYLTNLSHPDLRKAVLTVVPDGPLAELYNQHARNEQELAKLLEMYGPDHPEVKRTRVVLQTTNRQIEERLDGILIGLKARRESDRDSFEKLESEIEQARKAEFEMAIQRRPYYQAKRDLESLQYIREKLMMRILQEKVDAAIPRQ